MKNMQRKMELSAFLASSAVCNLRAKSITVVDCMEYIVWIRLN